MKWTAVLLFVPLLACAPTARQTPGDDDSTGGDDDTGGGGGGGGSTGGGSGCSDAAKLIYVVDENNNLAQFDAATKTFTQLGELHCPAGENPATGSLADPFSMAVDRDAQAYVLYEDNAIYKVDTTQHPSLPCTATGWTTSSNSTLQEFGMGYSSNGSGSDVDTLFVAGGQDLNSDSAPATSTLAMVDTTQWTATQVGPVEGWPELTGNANAELWGFFPDVMGDNSTTPEVAQIDKTSGNFLTEYQEPSLDGADKQPSAWAFGFYGGDYWVFLAFYNEETLESGQTSVYQIAGPSSTSGSPGQIVSTTLASVSGTPLVIVGAGVSTCAPVVIQ